MTGHSSMRRMSSGTPSRGAVVTVFQAANRELVIKEMDQHRFVHYPELAPQAANCMSLPKEICVRVGDQTTHWLDHAYNLLSKGGTLHRVAFGRQFSFWTRALTRHYWDDADTRKKS